MTDRERYRKALEAIQLEAESALLIPFYAYHDNEAGVTFATSLAVIRALAIRTIDDIKDERNCIWNAPSSPTGAEAVTRWLKAAWRDWMELARQALNLLLYGD